MGQGGRRRLEEDEEVFSHGFGAGRRGSTRKKKFVRRMGGNGKGGSR
jgi:hypothetical protein